ncbi:MAG: SBBP repeat-containing protein [Bacteroidetes bacterium]|nr:SBBP repeat-containing protein [Bacteroidota bacterium]
MKLLLIILFSFSTLFLFSQPALQWAYEYRPSTGTNYANSVFVDDSGYVYSTGVIQLTRYKCITVKQKPNGDTIWRRIDEIPNADQGGADVLVDSAGNVFVCGNPLLRKYDRNGNLLLKKFDTLNTLPLGAEKILKDSKNKLIIGTEGAYYGLHASAIVICKINPDDGSIIWRRLFNTETSGYALNDIKIDKNDNIIIAGEYGSTTPPNYADIIIAKCSSSGDSLWAWKYNGPGPSGSTSDFALKTAIDDTGNVYAACWSTNELGGGDFFTVKLTPFGDTVWTRRFNINNGGSGATDIGVDNAGNVYVTGLTSISNFTTIKYKNDGTFQWFRTLQGVAFPYYPMQTLDTVGNIYVGCEKYRGSSTDILICKYNPNGEQVWTAVYPGTGNSLSAHAEKILVDKNNFVYVCGVKSYSYLVLKYSQTVNIQNISEIIPESYSLYQNYPNPFNPNTKIRFSIKTPGMVELIITDVNGREIERNSNFLNGGTYEKTWEAGYYPSGIYFYSLYVNSKKIDSKKMVLLK